MTKNNKTKLTRKRIKLIGNKDDKLKKTLRRKKQFAGLGPKGRIQDNRDRAYHEKKHEKYEKKIRVQGFAVKTDIEKANDRKSRYTTLKNEGKTNLPYEKWVKNECTLCKKISDQRQSENTPNEKKETLGKISSRRCSDMEDNCKKPNSNVSTIEPIKEDKKPASTSFCTIL